MDISEATDEKSQAGDDQPFIPVTKRTKKGNKGRGGKVSLTQPVAVSNEEDIMSSRELRSCFSTAPSELCVMCQTVSTDDTSIQCDTCGHLYHLECCQVKVDDIATVRRIIDLLGWSCRACRSDLGKELQKLRDDVRDLQSQQGKVQHHQQPAASSSTHQMSTDTDDHATAIKTPVTNSESAVKRDATNISYSDVVQLVHKSVRDVTHRKRNVIVTGLLENEGWDDSELFLNLCEEHLSTKPRLTRLGAKRLGRNVGDIPRRLLVHLESEAAASELLNSARYLRDSTDDYVARNVFINADLSKEESKQAFERRQEKRRRQVAQGNRAPPITESTRRKAHFESNMPSRNTTRNYVFHNSNRGGGSNEIFKPVESYCLCNYPRYTVKCRSALCHTRCIDS